MLLAILARALTRISMCLMQLTAGFKIEGFGHIPE